jgi:hypothetical protein
MSTAKIAVTIEEKLLQKLDKLDAVAKSTITLRVMAQTKALQTLSRSFSSTSRPVPVPRRPRLAPG